MSPYKQSMWFRKYQGRKNMKNIFHIISQMEYTT